MIKYVYSSLTSLAGDLLGSVAELPDGLQSCLPARQRDPSLQPTIRTTQRSAMAAGFRNRHEDTDGESHASSERRLTESGTE